MDGMTKGKVIEFTLSIEPLSSKPRTIWVYLPADYETSNETYPVLYMFDGHNLFFEELSYAGTTWGMKDYLDTTGTKLIVVGQNCNHDGQERESEYCPFTPVKVKGWESTVKKGDITADWFVNTLKPYCEKHFRVSTKREDIGVTSLSDIDLNFASSPGCFQRSYNALLSKFSHFLEADRFSTLS